MIDVISKNISSKDMFKIECQKCGCKKVSLLLDRAMYSYESSIVFIKCNHCENVKEIIDIN